VGGQLQSDHPPHGKFARGKGDNNSGEPHRVRRGEEDEESKVLLHTGDSGEERDRQQLISPDHLPTSAMTHSPNSDTVSQKVSNETSKKRKVPDFSINAAIIA
jgi:hypothetical protein